ncbi:f5/8 type C domain protein [gut metagenome]|uniref:F5/8 type C domain protein n=1 Tax=gut metagenome TaxID=749906 RepID=J9GTA5_9ZZZZ
MKRLFYILNFVLVAMLSACGEYEQPYVGYIIVDRAVLDATANSSTTIVAETDIPSAISVASNSGADWCEVSINGKEITLTATAGNTENNYRTANIVLSCGYRQTTLTVLQKFDGQEFLQYDWTRWTATGNGVQTNDGGGYPSLFTEDRGKFWHSAYSPASVALPYILDIDMQEELECAMFHIGRRLNSKNGNNYGSVKTMNIYASTDKKNYEKVGGFTFELPWKAPDGTLVDKATSPLIPGYEEIKLASPVKARYIRLEITETNTSNKACQVAYFKAFEKI